MSDEMMPKEQFDFIEGRLTMATIQIDTREKPRAITKIIKTFDDAKIPYISSKMYVGDYCLLGCQ